VASIPSYSPVSPNKKIPEQAEQITAVFRKAGFTRFRRAAESPFNLILEARR
jgi:hypothetical protein